LHHGMEQLPNASYPRYDRIIKGVPLANVAWLQNCLKNDEQRVS